MVAGQSGPVWVVPPATSPGFSSAPHPPAQVRPSKMRVESSTRPRSSAPTKPYGPPLAEPRRLPGPLPYGRRFRNLVALCIPLFWTLGCYTFQPYAAEELGVGEDVRVRVTGAFSDSLAPLLGRAEARVVEGEVVQDEPNSVMIQVPVNRDLRGMRLETISQRVQIPHDAFVDVEIRQLSKPRTIGTIAAVTGAAAVIVITQFSGDNGGADRPGEGQPVESTISRPWFTVPVGALLSLLGR